LASWRQLNVTLSSVLQADYDFSTTAQRQRFARARRFFRLVWSFSIQGCRTRHQQKNHPSLYGITEMFVKTPLSFKITK
jgi:hypothetical protein